MLFWFTKVASAPKTRSTAPIMISVRWRIPKLRLWECFADSVSVIWASAVGGDGGGSVRVVRGRLQLAGRFQLLEAGLQARQHLCCVRVLLRHDEEEVDA